MGNDIPQTLTITAQGEELENILQFIAGSGEEGGMDLKKLVNGPYMLPKKMVQHETEPPYKLTFVARHPLYNLINVLRKQFPNTIFELSWHSFYHDIWFGYLKGHGKHTTLHEKLED